MCCQPRILEVEGGAAAQGVAHCQRGAYCLLPLRLLPARQYHYAVLQLHGPGDTVATPLGTKATEYCRGLGRVVRVGHYHERARLRDFLR
eukprot:7378454-Prymnesium_polylepis.1